MVALQMIAKLRHGIWETFARSSTPCRLPAPARCRSSKPQARSRRAAAKFRMAHAALGLESIICALFFDGDGCARQSGQLSLRSCGQAEPDRRNRTLEIRRRCRHGSIGIPRLPRAPWRTFLRITFASRAHFDAGGKPSRNAGEHDDGRIHSVRPQTYRTWRKLVASRPEHPTRTGSNSADARKNRSFRVNAILPRRFESIGRERRRMRRRRASGSLQRIRRSQPSPETSSPSPAEIRPARASAGPGGISPYPSGIKVS